jgi:hypothetical protein
VQPTEDSAAHFSGHGFNITKDGRPLMTFGYSSKAEADAARPLSHNDRIWNLEVRAKNRDYDAADSSQPDPTGGGRQANLGMPATCCRSSSASWLPVTICGHRRHAARPSCRNQRQSGRMLQAGR